VRVSMEIVRCKLATSFTSPRSHNPKVAGSNPAPATIENEGLADAEAASPFRLPRLHPGIGSDGVLLRRARIQSESFDTISVRMKLAAMGSGWLPHGTTRPVATSGTRGMRQHPAVGLAHVGRFA
jgi:hypothetical protein